MCPSQRNALLSALGALDPCGSKVIKFDITDVKPHLPYHVAFKSMWVTQSIPSNILLLMKVLQHV
jgi:hypothetical protein